MGHRTSDEELFHMPGSIYNRETQDDRKQATGVINRLRRVLKELVEAVESEDLGRIADAAREGRNTVDWMEY